jgi:RNA polymerase sigma-70 factor (ECF subfamily)
MNLPLSDEVITLFNRGDSKAFNRIFQEFYPAIFLFVDKLIHPSAATGDIATDAFLRLWENRGGFESPTRLRSFLFQTAKNLAFDHLRHLRTERKKLLAIQRMEWDPGAGSFQSAESHAYLLELIQQAIGDLPRRCREVFLLFFKEGLDNAEIADRLNISVKTVSNQKAIALKILKMKLTKIPAVSIPVLFVFSSLFSRLLHFFQFAI